ncbi:MAG: hypothetical protein AB8F65_08060 [Woeseiaceae bacterium]
MSKQDQPPPALEHPSLDRLGHTLLSLARHVWTLQDRQIILEDQLKKAGIEVAMDAAPGEELEGRLNAERQAFIENLMDSLTGKTDASRQ